MYYSKLIKQINYLTTSIGQENLLSLYLRGMIQIFYRKFVELLDYFFPLCLNKSPLSFYLLSLSVKCHCHESIVKKLVLRNDQFRLLKQALSIELMQKKDLLIG